MDNVFNLTFYGTNGGYEAPIRYFKGETEIVFDLSQIALGTSLIKIIVNFTDGSDNYTREFDFTNPDKILSEPIKHKFFPDLNAYHVVYYPTIYAIYANFEQFVYQFPIRISKSSFYSEYERMTVASSQFLDNSNNSIFSVIDTAKGDIINLVTK